MNSTELPKRDRGDDDRKYIASAERLTVPTIEQLQNSVGSLTGMAFLWAAHQVTQQETLERDECKNLKALEKNGGLAAQIRNANDSIEIVGNRRKALDELLRAGRNVMTSLETLREAMARIQRLETELTMDDEDKRLEQEVKARLRAQEALEKKRQKPEQSVGVRGAGVLAYLTAQARKEKGDQALASPTAP